SPDPMVDPVPARWRGDAPRGCAHDRVRAAARSVGVTSSDAFDVLFDAPGPRPFDLPEEIRRRYGEFGLGPDTVFANFVSSVDGAVALPGVEKSSQVIGGGSRADRFVVALLRAAADAVVVGAGTYRAHRGPWTAQTAQ